MSSNEELSRFGWSSFFSDQLAELDDELAGCEPFRVSTRQRDRFMLRGGGKPIWASARGRLFEQGKLPAVGDWVVATQPAVGDAVIEHVLERRSSLTRQAAGKKTESQVIAANLDVVFIVCSANTELNARRIERYLTAIWDGGAKPVVVINKTDLASDRDALKASLNEIGMVAPVALTSALENDVGEIRAHLSGDPPTTTAFVGSSGVGKSTLLNALFGERIQDTGEIRKADDKGRHTTTAREMFVSADAGILIDTPGMREMALWEGDAGVGSAFAEIEELTGMCKFRDCSHQAEPGCAVKKAVAEGTVSEDRLASYQKLLREIAHNERDRSAASRHAERLAGKKFGKLIKSAKEAKNIKG